MARKNISTGMLLLLIFASACWSKCAIAGLIVHTTPPENYWAHAELFPSVGWMDFVRADGSASTASGVVVHQNWVLTTAHYRDDTVGFRFGTGSNYLTNPGTIRSSTTVFRHESFVSAGLGYDLAMVYFPDPILNVSPATLFQSPLSIGMQIHLTGYGATGVAGTPTENLVFDGNRYAGVGRLDAFDIFSNVHFQSRFRDPILTPDNPLGIRGTPGSSGGGIFTEVNGEFQLIGLHSFGSTNNLYGSSSFPTMIDVGWVNGHIAAVPEPSSALLAVIGLSAMVVQRRRRALA